MSYLDRGFNEWRKEEEARPPGAVNGLIWAGIDRRITQLMHRAARDAFIAGYDRGVKAGEPIKPEKKP